MNIKLRVDSTVEGKCKFKGIKIRRADHTGDSCLATIDVEADNAVEVTWAELDNFMDECIKQFGHSPKIWAGRRTDGKTDLDWGKLLRNDPIDNVEEVLVHYPLVGG